MSSATKKDRRLEFRASARARSLIEEAAAVRGQSVSAFALSSLIERAEEVIQRSRRIELTDRDRDLFLTLLDKGANPALLAAARDYQEQME